MEAIASRLEAIASRLKAIAIRLEAIANRLEAIAIRLEAMASRLEAIASRLEAITNRLEAITSRLEVIAIRKEYLESIVSIHLSISRGFVVLPSHNDARAAFKLITSGPGQHGSKLSAELGERNSLKQRELCMPLDFSMFIGRFS